MNSKIFETLNPNKLLMRCAIPAAITSVFGALYSVIDGIFVGRYMGENALASINLVIPIIMIVESLANMIATGVSVNISILLGEKKRKEASDIFSFSIKIIILFSAIIGFLGILTAYSFVRILAPGATKDAVLYSSQYLKIYAIFLPLIPVYFAMDNYLRVCGKQTLSMVIGIASQVVNIVLDYILIVVLKKGIVAAALASCISISLGSIWMLVVFLNKKMDLYYTFQNINLKKFLRIIANGASEFFSSISMSVMSVITNLFLLKYGGTTAIAAFSILMYVDSIVGMIAFGISDSMQPAISYCYGANLIERMKLLFKKMKIAVVFVSICAFLFMYYAGPYISTVFINEYDQNLVDMSQKAIVLFSFSYLVGWVDMCYSSFFTAIDRPIRSLIVSAFGTLVFPVAFLLLLTPIFGLDGVWLMTSVSAMASGIMTIYLAKTLKLVTEK